MQRDRIVCGIQDEGIQRKLLAERDLTLIRATEIAVSMETAARDVTNLRTTVPDVNRIHSEKNAGNVSRRPKSISKQHGRISNKEKCNRCGESHASSECKFKFSKCYFCKKTGHIAKVCRSKGKSDSARVHNVDTKGKKDSGSFLVSSVTGIGDAIPPARIKCLVQGKPVNFEIDSGAPFSLIPWSTYEKLRKFCPPLEKTRINLHSYTNHPIEIKGVTNVKVMFKSKSENLPLLVVNEGTTNLAGRNWIYPLQLMSVFDKNNGCHAIENITAKETVQSLLEEFKELFSPDLGVLKDVKVHLAKKKDAVPKFFKARPVPYALLQKVDEELTRLVEQGILEPVKTAESAAPIVPVLKRDGHIRICGDFKVTTNRITELEQYPLPNIEDIFAQLSGETVFSKLDLKDAYCQLQLDEESKNLVVINTHKGLFRYTVMPFGIASAPAVFQREMDKVLHGLKAAWYLDDILVYGKDEADHLQNLNAVFTKLQEAGMKLNSNKCEFLKTSLEYLGHRIDKEGLHPVDSKVEAIARAPDPTNVDELRSFIGLVTYYAKFLPNMATVLAPLYELLKSKTTWKWGVQQKKAFEEIKKALQSSSLLIHFDNKKEVVLVCDASPYGLGAVLSHETPEGDRPIAFASRSLTKAEKNYSHIEKETLALVFGVTKFRKYLLGRTFTLLTDHRPLVNLLAEDKPVPSVAAARIQRWALTLSAYAYKIKYRKGSLNGNADACSRLPLRTKDVDSSLPPEFVLLLQQLNDSPVTKHMIAVEIERCPELKRLKMYIQNGFPRSVKQNMHPFSQVKNELSVVEDIILRGSRVFIPMKFRNYIMEELHSSHQGIIATKSLARSYVWWPGIDSDLESRVKGCTVCQQNASAPPAKHISWPVPEQVWHRIHIDHSGPVDGHMLLVVIDAKSKWLEVVPVTSTSANSTIVTLRSLFARFGVPRSLVSDNGPGFTSAEFAKFLSDNGVTHIRTAPYHPCSNGLAERAVRTTKEALRKVTSGTFNQRLSRFLFNYRVTPSASTGISPAVAMFGRPLRTRLDLLHEEQCKISEKEKAPIRKFKKGTPVWVRAFGCGPQWVPGRVLHPMGKTMCKVQTDAGKWTRHFDQLRSRQEGEDCDTSAVPESNSCDFPSIPQFSAPPDLQSDAAFAPTDTSRASLASSPQLGTPSVQESSSPAPPVSLPQVVQQSPGTSQPRRSQRIRKEPDRLKYY